MALTPGTLFWSTNPSCADLQGLLQRLRATARRAPHLSVLQASVGREVRLIRADEVVYFESENIDAVVKDLQAAGLVFDTEPADQRWLWREARLRDPSGNPICLFQAGENRLNPPWRLPEAVGHQS